MGPEEGRTVLRGTHCGHNGGMSDSPAPSLIRILSSTPWTESGMS